MNARTVAAAALTALALVAGTATSAAAQSTHDDAVCGYDTTTRYIEVTGRPGMEILIAVQRGHSTKWVTRTVTIGADGTAGWHTQRSIVKRAVGAESLTDDRECEFVG